MTSPHDDGPTVDGWTDRLGALAERFPGVMIRLGDWETRLLAERIGETAIDRPIYIAGLARSGSTILLETLARHPATATHRYRDFPMVLAPWAWNWFVDRAGRPHGEAVERAHRDRIRVTPESPEAFEEVVWTAFLPGLHDTSASAMLGADDSHPRFEAFYRDHIRKLVALRAGDRYLAKGNYNVTRLGYLLKLFPDARFVVPVRDPVAHVASLMRQHRHFCQVQAGNARVRNYMRRAGHFEFGLDRRAINTGNPDVVREIEALWDAGEEAAGWAMQWASVYGCVAEATEDRRLAPAIRIVRYEDMCDDPATTVSAVLRHCELDDRGASETARRTISAPTYYRADMPAADSRAIRSRTAGVAARFGYA